MASRTTQANGTRFLSAIRCSASCCSAGMLTVERTDFMLSSNFLTMAIPPSCIILHHGDAGFKAAGTGCPVMVKSTSRPCNQFALINLRNHGCIVRRVVESQLLTQSWMYRA